MKFLNKISELVGKIFFPASTTSEASLNIPHGVDPTSPDNGDMWTTTSGVKARVNGSTQTLAHTSQWSAISQSEANTGTATTSRLIQANVLKGAIQTHAPVKSVNGSTGDVTITIPTSLPANGGNATTATKLTTARTIGISGGATGTATSFDGSGNVTIPVTNISPDYIGSGYTKSKFYIDTHPENAGTIIPFINNDIAFLLKRGGSASVYYDGVLQSLDISNVFDGSPSYWAINPTGVTTITIELTLHKTFTWTNTMYVAFGASGWRSTNITFDVMNTNNSETVWTNKATVTGNSLGEYFTTFSHNNGTGFNKMRFTFSGWSSPTIFRIAQIGLINYGSYGLQETFISRGGSSIYGDLYPHSNNSLDLGSSSNKWANVYANQFVGKLNGDASSVNGFTLGKSVPSNAVFTDTVTTVNGKTGAITKADITALGIPSQDTVYTHPTTSGNKHIPSGGSTNQILRYSADGTAVWSNENNTTYSVATTSANGLMSSTDKSKLDGIASGAQVNQNAFSHVKVGTTTVSADSETDILELVAGSNVTLTPDATNDKVTISASDTITTINGKTGAITKADITALGIPAQDTVTTINGKTGAITKADITALGIPSQDTVYTHPTTSGNKHIPSGGSANQILRYSSDGTAVWSNENNTVTTINGKTGAITKADIVALGIPAQDTTYTSLPANGGNADTVDNKHASDFILKSGDTMTGNLTIANGVPVLVLKDSDSTGNAQLGYVQFQDSTGAQKGYIGFGTTSNSNLYIHNDYDPINGVKINGNTVWHAGNCTSLPANGGVATGLSGGDTRNNNYAPADYMQGGAMYVGTAGYRNEFKSVTTVGLSSLMTNELFVVLSTYIPWSDASGGLPTQVAYGYSTPCWRTAISATVWGDWKRINDGGSALTLQGYGPSVNTLGYSIVQRDANGYIHTNYFNSSRGTENSAAQAYLYDTGDGYMRKKTVDNVKIELGGADTAYTTNKVRGSIFQTTVPSSLASGTICFVYE